MTILTDAQKLTLQNHLASDPNGKGYASDIAAGATGYIVAKLNTKDQQKAGFRKINTLMIVKECYGLDESIVNKLEAAASTSKRTAEALIYLRSNEGLDIDDPLTQGMFGTIGFTQQEADALTAMALQPASEMDVLDLPQATDEMVWEALGA